MALLSKTIQILLLINRSKHFHYSVQFLKGLRLNVKNEEAGLVLLPSLTQNFILLLQILGLA